MSYKWEFKIDEENGDGYFQKLIEMSAPEVLSFEEAAERLNDLEREVLTWKNHAHIKDALLEKIKEQK